MVCSLAFFRLLYVSSLLILFYCSKLKQLEEELHVVTSSLRSLEISDSKVKDLTYTQDSLCYPVTVCPLLSTCHMIALGAVINGFYWPVISPSPPGGLSLARTICVTRIITPTQNPPVSPLHPVIHTHLVSPTIRSANSP